MTHIEMSNTLVFPIIFVDIYLLVINGVYDVKFQAFREHAKI